MELELNGFKEAADYVRRPDALGERFLPEPESTPALNPAPN